MTPHIPVTSPLPAPPQLQQVPARPLSLDRSTHLHPSHAANK